MFDKFLKKKIIKKKELENPIVDNRIVSDVSFAIRFSSFLKGIQVNDPADEEELEYFRMVASKLLTYQMATISTDSEKNYFKNLGYKL